MTKTTTDPLQTLLAANISDLRERRGLTLKEAADRAGVPEVTWRSWEFGKRWPSPASWRLIASVLKVTPKRLLRERE